MLAVSHEVRAALDRGAPVVALETTIYSTLGLPAPHGAEALRRSLAAIRAAGGVPALTCVLDGVARLGVDEADHARVLATTRKVAERDLGVAVAGGGSGATTVSASLALAARAGVRVFATGGIGGVHRGAHATFDVSADLDAMARHPVLTVSAGPKAFLDLALTLERLETAGVPVLGMGTDELPAFYLRSSGLPVSHRVDTPAQAAAIAAARWALGGGGLLVANPIPAPDELAEVEPALAAALADAGRAGLRGPAVTPFVMDRIARATAGRSVRANCALAEHNARVAAAIAAALAQG